MSMEKQTFEVKVFKTAMYCECSGELEFTGLKASYMNEDQTGTETKYWHKCNECGEEFILIDEFYPQLEYIPVNPDIKI